MGLSSPQSGGAADDVSQKTANDSAATHTSFGDKLLEYMKSKYPVAGGLANVAFGKDEATPAPMASAPLPQMPDYSQMISMNAQPKQGGGLSTILKLLAG